MFGKNFAWGAAASAYQVEGRAEGDGCGKTVWDTFCEQKRVYEGQDARIACDQIHRYKEDFALMRTMGIRHYRFSLNWARILPEGTGKINPAGIAFYQDMLKSLKENGITPYITLFHWEFPQALQDRGGWKNPESVEWFAEYARVAAEHFGEDCEYFITFNEPECFLGLGYLRGEHAPGLKLPCEDVFAMTHNVLKAHGAAVKALRKYAGREIKVGFAPTCGVAMPASEEALDVEAARRRYFSFPAEPDNWTWNVSWFTDPVCLGHYPEEGLKRFAPYLPEITKEDMELICQPIDFLGQNIYNGYEVRAGKQGEIIDVPRYPGFPKTASQWPVTPMCLYWGSRFLYERYGLPLYITENGMSCHDMIAPDGRVHDPDRITFLDGYLSCLKRAVEEGVDVRGYFLWSFLDNFEWARGYSERFGIVYVDYPTQKRIVKDSAYWYRRVIESNGEILSGNRPSREMLVLQPVLKECVWGGDRLVKEFGYAQCQKADGIGECWAVSAHKNGDCVIAEGSYQGKTLSWLYENHRELFGGFAAREFPLLVKIIDARTDLSIQVHPDDAYAMEHENGSFGKTECWYIMDCPEDARLVIGHHARTREELKELIDQGRYEELIRLVPVKKGDFIQINPGTVHAITGGFLLLETQQSSDITYRVYDYGRLVNGKPRQLHIKQSEDVIRVPDCADQEAVFHTQEIPENQMGLLVDCDYYKVWKLSLSGEMKIDQKYPFLILSVLSGNGVIEGRPVKKGDHLLLPAGFGEVSLLGRMELILSTAKESGKEE